MIDPRFYEVPQPLSASDIASLLGVVVTRGDPSTKVSSLAAASRAGNADLAFVEDPRDADGLRAGCVYLVSTDAAGAIPDGPTIIAVRHPRAAFATIADRLVRVRTLHATDVRIHASAKIHASATIEPGVVIGAGAAIGTNVRIGANAVIGPGVQIGADTSIGANASIRCALIGDGANIYPSVVIGEAGFGLAEGGAGARLTPHFGRVIVQNGVSIGAGSCIDRGLLEDTVIGEGTHIDNLCHIGHNCRIGAHVVMAAFAGVSGSSEVGDGVQFGGRVGLKDHVRIGAGARVAAGAAVLGDVGEGEVVGGYPAKPIRTWMRELAWLARAAQKRSTTTE